MKISIFTPTYNRGYIIHNLYNSLKNQTYKNFEWIIVDDGSIDNTKNLIYKYKNESDFSIIYYKQKNQGKHIAINKGISLATGDLFFIVDSDDYVTSDFAYNIINLYEKIKFNNSIAALAFPRGNKSGGSLVKNLTQKEMLENFLDIVFKYKISGEIDFAFKINILKEFLFPDFSCEKFCTEALIWNRISKKYKFLLINKTIVLGGYLKDGLSAKYWEHMVNSPQYSMLYFSELSNYNIPLKAKLEALKCYWGIALNMDTDVSFFKKLKKVPIFLSIYILFYRKLNFYFKKYVK